MRTKLIFKMRIELGYEERSFWLACCLAYKGHWKAQAAGIKHWMSGFCDENNPLEQTGSSLCNPCSMTPKPRDVPIQW